ncbi:MAG TPA: hypothetical protein VKU41_31295 [Polyangiaceae bacterium]|nr:hypothetical protein [Polyangiaceae bacterium]
MGDDEGEEWAEDLQSGIWPRASATICTRRRWRIDAAGQPHRSLTVFCPDVGHSRPSEACCSCQWNLGMAPDGHVECGAQASVLAERSSRLAGAESLSALAARVRVAVAVADVVCVAHDLPLVRLGTLPRCDMAVVVDDAQRPIGALFALEALRRAGPSTRGVAADRMSPIIVLSEVEWLSAALLAMACDRLRSVCVVDGDGAVVGAVSETTAMSWLASRSR